jgi:SAM-dependent methyltransferase
LRIGCGADPRFTLGLLKGEPTIPRIHREQGIPQQVVPQAADLHEVAVQLDAEADIARYRWAAHLAAGSDVLDAGCGTGSGTGVLLQGGARSVTGVDIDAGAIERAAATISPGGEALLADATDLPFASDSFDVVTCFHTLEYIAEPADLITELRRVLRPAGLLLISSPNPAARPASDQPSTHELPVGVFSQLLRQHFTDVELYHQRSCLGTFLEPFRVPDPTAILGLRGSIRQTPAGILAPASVVLAVASSAGGLPDVESVAVMGEPFELRRWTELLAERPQRHDEELAEAVRHAEQAEQQIYALGARLEQAELVHARVAELEERLAEARDIIGTFESSRLGRIGRLMFHIRAHVHRAG